MKKLFLLFVIFGNVLISNAQDQYAVFYESNKSVLSLNENKAFQKWLLENKNAKILAMNGYTDEDGSNQYNDSLAAKRVDNLYQLVVGKIKIREDFKKINFGENHQQSINKAENRKVILYFLKEKDLAKESEILKNQIKTERFAEKINFPSAIEITNFDGSTSQMTLDVAFMEQLNGAKAGEKIILNNLNFVINTFAVTSESRPRLYELLTVMQKNKALKISIQGHLCCVPVDRKDLSTQRAKAIKKFLELNGIDTLRMNYKGFGSSEPIHAIPEKTEAERAANRRVEIEILEN